MSEHEPLAQALSALCARSFGQDDQVENLHRLTGGANMETWAFDFAGHELILRRMPAGSAEAETEGGMGISIETEAAIVSAAGKAGVSAPQVIAVLTPEDDLGSGFVMARLGGETLAKRIQKDEAFAPARERFVEQVAQELVAIHAMAIEGPLADLPKLPASMAVSQLRERYDTFGCDSVMLEAAFAWLSENEPEGVTPRLLHGDFRLGNLLIEETGLSAVLDWELAHIGDPAQDLAYMCAPPWRFANHDLPVAGLGEVENLLAAYEAAGGEAISPQRFRFWLVYSTLWWSTSCLLMANFWRDGFDRSLERAVIGRRVSEVELELVMLLEGDGQAEAKVDWQVPDRDVGHERTANHELATALGEWVSEDILPHASGRDKFQAHVALTGLGMIERAAAYEGKFAEAEDTRLKALGLTRAGLLDMAKAGKVDFAEPEMLKHVRLSALAQLYIDQPRYPGFKAAIAKWT